MESNHRPRLYQRRVLATEPTTQNLNYLLSKTNSKAYRAFARRILRSRLSSKRTQLLPLLNQRPKFPIILTDLFN